VNEFSLKNLLTLKSASKWNFIESSIGGEKISAKFWGLTLFRPVFFSPTCFRLKFAKARHLCHLSMQTPRPHVVVPQPQDAHLDAVQHIAEEQDEQQDVRPTVLDMFAGAGGTGLGFHRAGFQIVGVVEWNAHAALTYPRI
jgi:hypothetical protein